MKSLRLFLVWMTVAVLAASPAPAETRPHPSPPVVLPETFIFHGDDFILPTPTGFCAPTGVEAEKLRAAGEPIAQNLFTRDRFKIRGLLVRCPGAQTLSETPDMLMVGVVPLPDKVMADRRAFLAAVAMRADADPYHFHPRIILNPTPQYIGSDDFGVYMGARLKAGPSGAPEDVIEMIGAALVKQRVIGVIFTTPKDASTDLNALRLKLQTEVRGFVELNEALEPPIGWTPKRPNKPGSAIAAGSDRRRRARAGSSGW